MKISFSKPIRAPQSSTQALARSIAPGDEPQVQADLATFGEPVLGLLHDYGVKVAVLDEGETLAQSPALRFPTEAEYAQERLQAKALTKHELAQTKATSLEDFAAATTRELRKKGLEFHFGVSSRVLKADQIAEQQNIEPAHREHWTKSFEELNEGLPQGLYILPHVYFRGKAIPENRLRGAGELKAEYVERSLGLNRPEDRLVLVHKKFTPMKAVEVGNYRLVVHELGHALDHLLDRLTGFPGFGTLHRQTVDRLFEADTQRAEASSVGEAFTTTRASENVREYFAEGVEAYLTESKHDDGEHFRKRNSKSELQVQNPELYNYIDKIFQTDFPRGIAPEPPARPLLPDFVPDPDTAVIYLG